jgi:hypothetical protein
MSTTTMGTAATTTLTALLVSNGMADADVTAIVELLKGNPGASGSPIGSGYLRGTTAASFRFRAEASSSRSRATTSGWEQPVVGRFSYRGQR